MSGASAAPPSQHVDEGGEIVLNRFYDFLAKFTSSAEGTTDGTDGVQLYRDYLAQIGAMVQNDKNTVYVDVQHVFAVRRRPMAVGCCGLCARGACGAGRCCTFFGTGWYDVLGRGSFALFLQQHYYCCTTDSSINSKSTGPACSVLFVVSLFRRHAEIGVRLDKDD